MQLFLARKTTTYFFTNVKYLSSTVRLDRATERGGRGDNDPGAHGL